MPWGVREEGGGDGDGGGEGEVDGDVRGWWVLGFRGVEGSEG